MYAEYLHEYTDDLERVLALGYHSAIPLRRWKEKLPILLSF